MLGMLRAVHDFLIQKQYIGINFASNLGKWQRNHTKWTECLVVIPLAEHRSLSDSFNSNIGKFWFKTVCIKGSPPQVTDKNVEKFGKTFH